MKNFRKDRGITLIALVVTIVVLLILAGITISTLFGENGIINAARRAEQDNANAENTTNQGLKNLEGQMNNAMDSSGLMNLIKSNSFITAEQGNQIIADRTGKSMIIPVGFKIAEDSANEIDKGVVIEDKEHNQYVWVPVSDFQFGDMFGSTTTGTVTNYYGKLYNFKNSTNGKGSPINSAIGSNSDHREPDILTDTTYGDASTGTTYEWANGIEQLKTVVGITADSDAVDANQNILDKWKNEMQTKFNEMARSVKEYKGFYIGRYEASSLNTANPKTVKNADPNISGNMTSVNWYNMYKNMQGMEKYSDSGVQSNAVTNMIWGCQWDRTLDWIAQTNEGGYGLINDSRTWGNHKDSQGDAAINSGTKQPSGTNPAWQKNNIFDLAGNLHEWTMEATSTYDRTTRGGSYYFISGSRFPASSRGFGDPSDSDYYVGSRPALYVKVP